MNKLKSYIIVAAAMLAFTGGMTSCQDNFDAPNIGNGPVATMTPNTTISEVKEWLWQNSLNYCDSIFTRDYYTGVTANPWEGEHVIISGRVISSDYAGNCFKYIILQDETGALNFSINSYNLYLDYRRGQEIVVDLTGMFMGKYRGLEQVGFPSWNSSINGYETSFMGPEMFNRQRQLNGMPKIELINTIEISSFNELGTTPAELRKWQSQLIRINNVKFEQSSEAAAEGITTLSTYHSSGVSQTIVASDGSTGTVRTSGYANFWNMELPTDPVDVILLVGYYGSNDSNAAYQFTLIDAASIITDPTVPEGGKDNPYTIGRVLDLIGSGEVHTGWVQGYIVGTVAPEVTEVNNSDDVEWTATPVLENTMVIGPTPDCTDVYQCLVIELAQGTALYNQSLAANPENYKKEIVIQGAFDYVMGNPGVVSPGSAADFMIDGQGGETAEGDGSEANPYSCAQVIKMAPSSTTDAVESNVWVNGYIVGYYENYEAHFTTSTSQRANILISDNPATQNASECVCIQLVAQTEPRNALNLVDNPSMLGRLVAVYGDVMKYNTLPGIKNTSKYALGEGGSNPGGDTPSTPGDTNGSGTETDPYDCASIISMNPQSTTEAVASNIWVEGYIVGYYENYAPHFEVSSSQRANILLSDNANASEASQCIDVQLLANTDTRNALNLVDNPGVLGKKVKVYGDVMKYNTLPGIKNTSNYVLDGQSGGNTGGDNTGGDTGKVMTVAEALAYINAGNSGTQTVTGQITKVEGYNSTFGQVSYYISDPGVSNELYIYCGFWLNGEKFTSESQLEVGATVVVKGELKNYNGTPEMNMKSVILSYTPPTGGGNTGGNTGGDNTGGDNTGGNTGGGSTGGDANTAYFDFSHPDTLTPPQPADKGSKTDNGNTYEPVSDVKFTDNGVTVSATKGISTDARIYYQSSGAIQFRIHNGATLTISAPAGIESIEFGFNNATSALNTTSGEQYSKANPTVEGNGATQLSFTCTSTVQINTITVVTK